MARPVLPSLDPSGRPAEHGGGAGAGARGASRRATPPRQACAPGEDGGVAHGEGIVQTVACGQSMTLARRVGAGNETGIPEPVFHPKTRNGGVRTHPRPVAAAASTPASTSICCLFSFSWQWAIARHNLLDHQSSSSSFGHCSRQVGQWASAAGLGAHDLLAALRRAERAKDRIVRCNLRLVSQLASRHASKAKTFTHQVRSFRNIQTAPPTSPLLSLSAVLLFPFPRSWAPCPSSSPRDLPSMPAFQHVASSAFPLMNPESWIVPS